MSVSTAGKSFTFAPVFMLFVPCAAISYFCEAGEIWPAAMLAIAAVTCLGLLIFVVRHFEELLAGFLGALLLVALLGLCALIPVVGWIADVLIILFALSSILASISSLFPYALKAAVLWAVFLVAMAPAIHHPVISPLMVFIVSLGMGAALGKRVSPFDEFILMIASIPLLAAAVVSLGRLFQSGFVLRSVRMDQNVSGYTTRAGVQVGDYTRTITKTIPVATTSVNPAAAAVGSAAGRATKDD